MPGYIIIRADESLSIGTGHVMRCMALAHAWQREGGKVAFLGLCESMGVREKIQKGGFDIISLPNCYPSPEDLQTTLNMLNNKAARLVLDGYHFDATYQKAVRDAGHFLMVVDDNAHLPQYHANILLNQNINARSLSYCIDSDTRLLLGTKYTMLRPEFMEWANLRRHIPDLANKVLVTMGGSDPDNVTQKVVRALAQVPGENIEVKVVVGPSYPHLQILRASIHSLACGFQILQNITDMSALMAWADVAVTAGGSTCWELAYMGLPALVIVLADNQKYIAEGMDQAGAAINLNWHDEVSTGQLAEALSDLLKSGGQRRQMSEMGKSLVDGLGAARVAEALQVGTKTESSEDAHSVIG